MHVVATVHCWQLDTKFPTFKVSRTEDAVPIASESSAQSLCYCGCSYPPQPLLDAAGGSGLCWDVGRLRAGAGLCWNVGRLRGVGNSQLTQVQAQNDLILQRRSSAHVISNLV